MKRFRPLLFVLPLLLLLALLALLLQPLLRVGGEPKRSAWQAAQREYVERGWEEHAAAYEMLLASPRTRDPTGRRHYAWATEPPKASDASEALSVAGPLLLDMLANPAYDQDARADALDVMAHVARTSEVLLHELLLGGSRSASGNDLPTRRLLARALATLPRPAVKPQQVLDALAEDVASGERELGRLHLETVSRAGGLLETENEKDVVTKALRTLGGLPRLVDEPYLIQRVALIGGPEASAWFLQYVDPKPDPASSAWALDVAGRLDYSDDLGIWLVAAIEGRAPAVHPDPVSRRQAVNAFRDLVARYATGNPLDRKVLGKISARLGTIEEAEITLDERLEQTFETLQQELADALGE